MGFHRTLQPRPLDRAAMTEVIARIVAEEVAFVVRTSDPFGVDHDCLNPAGHDFIASCSEIACRHCGRLA